MGYVTNGACKIGRVEIGNHVFIGHGAIILCNTRIGDYAVIGAGSVVTGDVPERTVFAGNPARFIKNIDEFEEQHKQNIKAHPQFDRPWREWYNMKESDWINVRKTLQDIYGYIVREK